MVGMTYFIFKFLAYLSVSNLELEANKLYDRANNYIKQHFLQGVICSTFL